MLGMQFYDRQMILAARGVPGCGKSTYSFEWLAAPGLRARVSRDAIRYEVLGKDFGVDEKMVTSIHDSQLETLLNAGYSVIVDNTHIPLKTLRVLSETAKRHKIRFAVIQFDVPLEIALERNANRDRVVPEDVIKNMYDRLQASPLPDEWRF